MLSLILCLFVVCTTSFYARPVESVWELNLLKWYLKLCKAFYVHYQVGWVFVMCNTMQFAMKSTFWTKGLTLFLLSVKDWRQPYWRPDQDLNYEKKMKWDGYGMKNDQRVHTTQDLFLTCFMWFWPHFCNWGQKEVPYRCDCECILLAWATSLRDKRDK